MLGTTELPEDLAAEVNESGVRPARRPVQRAVKVAPPSGKILEGLPTLEPKVRPA
jgi:hypothetical protein